MPFPVRVRLATRPAESHCTPGAPPPWQHQRGECRSRLVQCIWAAAVEWLVAQSPSTRQSLTVLCPAKGRAAAGSAFAAVAVARNVRKAACMLQSTAGKTVKCVKERKERTLSNRTGSVGQPYKDPSTIEWTFNALMVWWF